MHWPPDENLDWLFTAMEQKASCETCKSYDARGDNAGLCRRFFYTVGKNDKCSYYQLRPRYLDVHSDTDNKVG